MANENQLPCTVDFVNKALNHGFGQEAVDYLQTESGQLFCRRSGECALNIDKQGNMTVNICERLPGVAALLVNRFSSEPLVPDASRTY